MFDVIIVGSGVAGGTAAQLFCEAGLRVLVMEAGGAARTSKGVLPTASPAEDVPSEELRRDELQRFPIQARCYAFQAGTSHWFADDVENPYTVDSGSPFSWIRARAVGGKSLLWAGHCYRMGDADFAASQRDGIGEDWPFRYDELAPYYDEAERLLHVVDAVNAPYALFTRKLSSNGIQGAHSGGLNVVPARISHHAEPGERCCHCGSTSAACVHPVNSAGSTLTAASGTGLVTLWEHCQVHTVTVDSSGKVTGVTGIETATGRHFEAKARLVFLCASALESTRILLNSTSSQFAHGLGNSSGVLGHYLMDHVSGISVTAMFDGEGDQPPQNARAGMFYIPRWQNLSSSRSHAFLRGYGYQGFILRADHDLLPCGRTAKKSAEAPDCDSDGRLTVRLIAFGEMLPVYENRVEIDPDGARDAAGIPVLRIHCRHKENELAMARDMASTAIEYLQAAGGEIADVQQIPWEPGLAIHEAGTCRMGNNPRTSVLNGFGQCHEAANLFVTDASCFPSIGTQNPVLTIMAITMRACRCAIQQLRSGCI